jgi:hypothetical protein
MLKTVQDIINGVAINMIANGKAWLEYRNIGRDTSDIEYNLLLLYNLYWGIPYFDQNNLQDNIGRAQTIINQTAL